MYAFVNGTIYSPLETIPNAVLLVEQKTIRAIGTRDAIQIPSDAHIIDAHGQAIIPGLIDLHTYGCLGASLTAPDKIAAELPAFARNVARFGVTRFLISPTMGDRTFIAQMLSAIAETIPHLHDGAQCLGIHLEGPWLDPAQRGAFPIDVLHAPTIDEALEYLHAARGYLKIVTLAGNLPGANEAAKFLCENGVRVSFGHSSTDYATARDALASGNFQLVTHVYNAMTGLHHRQPGVLGAVLSADNISGMLICDGIHAHPAAVKILLRALGTDRVILVTDAIPGGGMTEGTFTMLNQTARIVDGVARLENGTIAGSILTLNRAVMNARAFGKLSLNEALKMATLNPARALGVWHIGQIDVGADADIALIDDAGNVRLTMVAGQIINESKRINE
jgi:N-acetylglucosamine-6-phosphate deacetylase